ncbi:dynein axonemal heavy chain 5-like [Ruditapes philippinarum]|uniref:dynein axonemal heavy chain 5-like n=1 Tax=Ruditapes philippinarum TaxID=129788 RepID=UPI00295AAA71|nr:dynein axonemal heavy chain 5-like [Ruditapes philippinarum]
MDERHWWIASKIQETFKIGGYDNPTLLEDFMIEETTLAKINKFLKAGGPCRLFFYCEKPETGIVSTRELHVTGTLASLKDTNLEHVNILYFLRNRVDKDVDGTRMERDIFCGELKHNTIETLTTLLSDVYIPLVKAQKDWGECNPDGQNQLMNNMDKFLTALNESTASLQSSKQMMLKQPDHIVLNDFKQQRAAALDPQLISQYEELVTEWMNTIEAVLTDTSDERFMDPNAGPLSELERWRRRQRLLTNITEQLKGKECKAVIGVLITAKSRLLKKWKQIDAAITDGMNDTKDKVKFLESLKRHFDQLYSVESTPSSIINTAIPGLANSVKQMDSISRYYARTGFLGLMFTKVTNQLVMACKEYIKNCTLTMEDDDLLWDRIQEEIEIRDTSNTDVDPKIKLLKSQVESKLKPGATGRNKAKEGRDLGLQDDTLYGRLKACLTLQGFYRETLRSLRDSIGQSSNMSHFPSLSSVGGPGSFTTRFFVRTKSSHIGIGSNRGLLSGTSRVTGSSPKKGVSSLLADVQGHGVPMTDEEAIMSHFDLFCNRIRQLIDVINTLAQYTKMVKSTRGVPKPRKEDLVIDDGSEQEEWRKYKKTDDAKPMPKIEFEEEDPDLAQVTVKMASPDRSLRVIAEDEEVLEEEDADAEKDEKKMDIYTAVEQGDDVFNTQENNQGLTEEELATLRRYYPEDEEDEGPAISTIIAEHLTNMTTSLSVNVTTKTMLDVESKDKDRFDDHYSNFSKIVGDVEKFLASYLHVIFCRKMKTQQGLDIITRLQAVQNRPGIRATLAEKFVEIFNWYEADLEEVHQIYEQHKENPQLVRNAPPVAGAIHWSRQLLKRIEDPMKIFRDNKAITQLGDFGRIVRIYNRLATALVTFESLWFTQWKGRIDQARNGLRATLFVHHPVTNEIVVNADESNRKCVELIPDPLKNFVSPLITEYVNQQLQPGLSTLAWNSMNIDAFLHQIHSATTKLKNMQKQVNDVMEQKVFSTLDTITNFYLFDHELAFSRAWPPELFREEMMRTAVERSNMLQDYVETVMEGLQTVSNILAVKKAYSLVGMSMSNLSATAFVSKKKANSMESVKKCITRREWSAENLSMLPDPHGKGKRVSVIVDPEEIERERVKAQQEEQLVLDLIAYFRDHVYEAVLSATSKSLALLAESCGCDSEVVRVISAMSNQSSDASSPSPRNWGSRAGTPVMDGEGRAQSAANSRPLSSLSQLSTMTWTTEKTHQVTFLQFEVEVKFSIPTISVEPTLDVAQTAVADVAKCVIESNRNIVWMSERGEESFYDLINDDENVVDMMSQLACVVQDLDPVVNKHLFHFSYYNFLWKDDMHGNFKEFISSDPGIFAIKREVERYLYIEKKVLGIPRSLPVGPILLQTDPIKDALHGFSMAWKTQFASVLHEEAKKKLDQAVLYRSNVRNRLELHVQTLDQLNSALHLLEELRDMENKIDGIYLPIETMYTKLREFELRLPRQEVEEVDALRENWTELMDLAEQVREVLLKERRGAFEQELDKQVKTFVVEVIQFRNAFDAQGPAVPGIPPAEAVSRLQDFQQRYHLYDSKRKTLDSVSKLFGIPCKPFAELDKTGEELDLLSQLYGLFQKFIRFDTRFRDTLWAEVDLDASYKEIINEDSGVESYWDECLALPSKLKDWDAYNDLKSKLQTYLEVFPLLNSLAAKLRTGEETPSIREIRNRHWLQVMHVTGSSFQLEANVFRLCHLLDIGLIKHKAAIEEICLGASRELELEIKMRMTEEEWTEQVLAFEHYKRRGPIYLDKVFTERLLEQLEDAQALLANMLTSRYIGPLRDEAASWAEKLKEVAEVLELWLEVQDLWQYLEAVFSNQVAARELPQEAKRFARIDKSWTKMMKRAFDTRNVLQCCYGGEVPKAVLLRHVYEELEICFKSLVGYLDNKRRVFPRFYYVSDPILLAILSRPTDLESVKPHLKSIFSSINDVKLEETRAGPIEPTDEVGFPGSGGGLRSTTPHSRAKTSSVLSAQNRGETPPKIDKRLTQVYRKKGSSSEYTKKRKGSTSEPEKMKKPTAADSVQMNPWSGIIIEYAKKNAIVEDSRINMNPSALQQGPTYLPSEGIMEEIVIKDAVSVSSADGESFLLSEKVTLTDEVEIWLSKLRDSVCKTIREMNIAIIQDCNNGVPIDEWAAKYPAQVCRLGLLYHWTKECDMGITEIKFDRKALQGTLKKYIGTVSKLPTVLSRGQWRNLEDPMLPLHKNRLECMITSSQFLRDALDQLCQRKLREVSDFEWRRSLRCYYQPIVEQKLPTSGNNSNSATPEISEERYEPLIWILDTSYQNGNEFYGMNTGVALTPVTERCFLTMSQALQRYQGSAVTGPVGAGKTETVKGLANILGQFLGVFQCSEQTDPTSLAKIIQGTAMDGCWCCFDEAQALGNIAMAVMFEHLEAVTFALKARHTFATLTDGQEIAVKRTTSVHMTINLSDTQPISTKLGNDIRLLFRPVSVIKPDMGMIMRAKSAALGFKAPVVLGSRLKVLAELAKDQLPAEVQHHFSVEALVGVLKKAMLKRKYIRDEKTQDKLDLRGKEETSRSNSQASDSRPVLPQQSSTEPRSRVSLFTQGNVKMAAGAHRKTGTPNPMTAAGKVEHALVAQTIEEIMAPRLTGETMQIFKNIVKDTFAALPDSPPVIGTISARTRGFDIDQALENKAKERGLIPHKPWLSKCNQLYNLSSIHHGLIVAGPPGAGKSTCIQTLIDALSSAPKANLSRVSSGSKGSSSSEKMHKLIRINPLVVDESDLMFGYLTPSNDWVDGIFTNACKKANRNLSKTWLCLDGPLNTGWADNFNSVLNSDKVLHLRNGDKLFLSDNINIIFETARLPEASPATVARCGILYIDKDVVGWKPIAKSWLDSRTPQEIHEKDEAKSIRLSYRGTPVSSTKFNTTPTDDSVEAIDNAIREKTVEGVLQRAFQKTLDPVINFVLNDAKPRLKLSEVGMFKTCLGLLAAMLADNIEIGGELHIERLYLFCLIWTFGGLLDANDRKSFSDLLKNTFNSVRTYLPDDDRDICVFDYYVDESGEWDPWISRVPEAVYADNQNMLGEVFVDTVDTIRTRILMDFASASGQNVLLVGPPGSGKTTLIDEFMDFQDSADSICKRLVFSGASTAKQLQQFIEANIYHRQGFVYGAKENKMLKVFIDDVNLPVPDQFNVQRCNQLLRQLLDDKVLCTQQKPFEWKTVEGLNIISAMSMSEHPSVNNQMLSSRLLRHFAVFNLPGPQDEALKSIVHGILEANVTDNDKPGLEIDLHNNIVKASCQILQALQNVLRPTPLPGRYHYLFTLKDLTTCYQCLKRLPDESMADEIMVVSLWKHEMNRIVRDRIARSSDLNWFDEIMEKTITTFWPKLDSPLHEHFVTFPTDARLYQRPVTSMGAKHFKIQLQPVETLRDLHSCLHMHLTRYNEEFGNVRLNIMLSDFVIAHIIRVHRILSFHHGGNMLLVGAVGSHLTTLCQLALHVADVNTLKMDTSKQSNFFDGLRSAVRLTGSEGKILTLVFTARDLEDPVYLDAINSVLISGEYPHLFSNDELEGLLMAIGPSMKREFPSMSVDPMKFFIARVRCNLHMIICIQPGHKLLQIASRQYPGLLSGCNINYMCDWPQEALLGEASYFITKKKPFQRIFKKLRERMPWAGDLSPEITLSSVKQHEKKKEQLKVTSAKVPNLPYSKLILNERISCGADLFPDSLESFRFLYTLKSKERTQTVEQLKKVLATLDQTRSDAKVMKKAIKNTTGKFEDAKVRTEELLEKLTHKATILEKLKAKVGLSTSLDAYLHLNEMEAEEVEEDELLKQEYNYLQVLHWKGKVDRNVIERLRAFTSPPVLVGMVMEMIMILIGKRLPSQRIEMKDYGGKDDNMSSRMSSSSSGTKIMKKMEYKIAGKKDETGRVDRAQWKAMVNTMSDSTKFVDMLHNVSWEDGLPEDVLRAVESCLSQGKDGELGVTGEGSLLENAQDVNIHAKKRTPSPDNTKGITIAGAKYSSEDSATLVQYTIAIVEYTRRCGPLKASLERMNELQREIEENDRLQKEKEQEAEFDQAVRGETFLEMELISMNERLKAATEMVDVGYHGNLRYSLTTTPSMLENACFLNARREKNRSLARELVLARRQFPIIGKDCDITKLAKGLQDSRYPYRDAQISSTEKTDLKSLRDRRIWSFWTKLEKQMRTNLSSDVRLMNDLQATKKLAELKKQYDETVETQTRVEMSEGSILKARDGFRSIAQRAAVCFDVTQYMREVNPLYQISYNRFLDIYDAAISHSERSAIKAVLEKVTSNAYYYTARGVFERDRFIYALLLAIEVEDSLDRLGPGEREFLISPDYSSVVMLSLGHIQQSQENKITQTKKPFDWMTDDQFHNLQVLATHFEWFQEMFDRMPKDGRETQWRNLCETDSPDTTPLPDKMDEVYKPMQRLCVVRAVRSDKIMQASTVFINVVLGKNSLPAPAGRKGYYGDVGIDFPVLVKQSSPMVPIMLLYTREAEVALKMFNDFSYKKQNKTLQVSVTDNNPNTERTARKYLQKGMAEGMWVLLHNAQNAPQLLLSLESILEELSATTPPDPQFRVWISSQAIPEVLPVRLIQNSVRTILDSPKVMKDSIVRSFSNFEPDILKQSTRAEWPLMLHNLCYLHAAIQLRTRFGFGGWNNPADFLHIGNFEIQESLNFITSEFKDQIMFTAPDGTQQSRITSWTGIRYMLSEVIYGSYSTDVNDQQSLSAMVDYWVSPTAVKKDFEVARLKYRHPAAFFNPNVRLNSLIQALEGINYHFLDVPEACHIHPNVENHEISSLTLLGDDQYVFTRLNRVFDSMPSTDTLTHKLFPRPPTPFEGPALAGVSAQSNNPAVVGQGVFATASFATFKMRKDVELWEICFTMLQKVPKAYNKDYIVEKVKKLGGFTTFNCYIMKELETMYKLLTEIKQTLTMIRNACETDSLGDQVSDTVLSAADDLYHLRIPRVWCKMSGPSAPPLTWGLGSWLNELQNRCHHFEKILILGREKMPAYWLGAFFNPRGLLALMKQDYIKQYSNDRSGNFEQFVFQTEVTSRDKDHLRDPPQEGMFVYGIYIWGCAWEKTTGELQDAPPRSGYATLPVVHLTCWPANEKPILQDSNRAAETYQCPVYASRIATREPIMELDVRREGIPSARWSLRGLSATIRPY